MDGELDAEAMHEVERVIDSDESAKRYVLDTVKSGAHLRSALCGVIEEDIPDRLLEPFITKKSKPAVRKQTVFSHMIRMAAAVVLLLAGFGISQILNRSESPSRLAFVEPLSGPYRQVVDTALENYLSGTSHEWRQDRQLVTVRVTPLKTYRDKNGVYFREYRFEVERKDRTMFVNGLAYRASKGNWKTKALYF